MNSKSWLNSEVNDSFRHALYLISQGRDENAFEIIQSAVSNRSLSSELLLKLGQAFQAIGSFEQAQNLYVRTLELDSNQTICLVALGTIARFKGSINAAKSFQQQAIMQYCYILASGHSDHQIFIELGMAYAELGDTKQALEALEKARMIKPDSIRALLLLASNSKINNQYEQALKYWDEVLALDSSNLEARTGTASILIQYGMIWDGVQQLKHVLRINPCHHHATFLLQYAYSISGISSYKILLSTAHLFWSNLQQETITATAPYNPASSKHHEEHEQKIKIGILSSEIGNHVVSFFLESFLDYYDRSLFDVQLIEVISRQEDRAILLRQKANAFWSIEGMPLIEARKRIQSHSFDLIIETSGFTSQSGLAVLAERCAPVQCHYIGFHASTGLNTIDYFIGDQETVSDDLADQFTEKLWQLPRPWLALCDSLQSHIPVAKAMASTSVPIFGSFNKFAKIREETILYWAGAMHRVPSAEMHIKAIASGDKKPQTRILCLFEKHGILPSRIKFLPVARSWVDHMICYNSIDLALDTTPWSSATNGFESLAMGVPLIGIRGKTMAGRMSSSILKAIGHEDWIADSPNTFADMVERLSSNLQDLRVQKARLQKHVLSSQLFDARDLTQYLQKAFLAMVNNGQQANRSYSPNTGSDCG